MVCSGGDHIHFTRCVIFARLLSIAGRIEQSETRQSDSSQRVTLDIVLSYKIRDVGKDVRWASRYMHGEELSVSGTSRI